MRVLLATILALVLAACAGGAPYGDPFSSPNAEPIADATVPVEEYRLGSGDKLRIIVFNEADLSGEFLVDGSGMVSMPLIGEVAAMGLTVREFQRSVETSLKDGYLNDPKVSAEVLNFRPYYILGEVNRPGTYPFSDNLTVLNAVATAEGFTYRANQRVVFIRRANDTQERQVPLTSTTRVSPGDTIRIAERIF
jgi:polysaccharide export outer membrane protein